MTIGMRIIDPSNSNQILKIDNEGQARVLLYDAAGRPIVRNHRAAIAADHAGMHLSGADYKVSRLLRSGVTGELAVNTPRSPILQDILESSNVDLWQWIQTTATMTISQSVAGGLIFNAGNSVAATVGAMHTSHKRIVISKGWVYQLQVVAKPNAHQGGNIQEIGFGSPAAAIPSTGANIVDGACFRKDTSGNWKPVIATNSQELEGAVMADNAAFTALVATGEFAVFSIELHYDKARFTIQNMAGAVVASADLEMKSITNSPMFANPGLQILLRNMNNTAPASAVQLVVKSVTCDLMEGGGARPWRAALGAMGKSSLVTPTNSLQAANWANSAAATARNLSNTTAAEATLGGQVVGNAVAGAETDYILIGWQNPSVNRSFIVEEIKVSAPIVGGAALATTDTTVIYFWAANSSAVSLATAAPYSPMRQALPGSHTGAVGLAIGKPLTGDTIVQQMDPPVAIYPSRFLHIGCRIILGSATPSQTLRWLISVQGYYE